MVRGLVCSTVDYLPTYGCYDDNDDDARGYKVRSDFTTILHANLIVRYNTPKLKIDLFCIIQRTMSTSNKKQAYIFQ